jgi:hypothetical protein
MCLIACTWMWHTLHKLFNQWDNSEMITEGWQTLHFLKISADTTLYIFHPFTGLKYNLTCFLKLYNILNVHMYLIILIGIYLLRSIQFYARETKNTNGGISYGVKSICCKILNDNKYYDQYFTQVHANIPFIKLLATACFTNYNQLADNEGHFPL